MKKKKWLIICIMLFIGCILSGSYIVYYVRNQQKAEKEYEEARTEAGKQNEEEKESADADETKQKKTVEIPIDFASLQKENDEIYAWIKVPGTSVDYPIVQSSTDDTFYVHKGIDKQYLYAGAIYTEMSNAKDFSDPNTVIYGHNMKSGSMFATLHNFRDRDFFDANREILIYTPEHILHYTIFAAYTYDDRHILNCFDFSDKKEFQKYLDEIYDLRSMDAYFLDEPKVTTEDKIITLSTCVGNDASSRYLVQGVLTETE